MANTFSELDTVAQRLSFYRLEPSAILPDETTVKNSAAAAGIHLIPDDYIDYCCRFGAGAFDLRALASLPDHCPLGETFWVDILYAIGAARDWNPLELLQANYAGRIPEQMLPIGSDPGGNLLLLGVEGREGLYVWDHEHLELLPGEFEDRANELHALGVAVQDLDVDSILVLWDTQFPTRVTNSSGYGNLYRVADSFVQLCSMLQIG